MYSTFKGFNSATTQFLEEYINCSLLTTGNYQPLFKGNSWTDK